MYSSIATFQQTGQSPPSSAILPSCHPEEVFRNHRMSDEAGDDAELRVSGPHQTFPRLFETDRPNHTEFNLLLRSMWLFFFPVAYLPRYVCPVGWAGTPRARCNSRPRTTKPRRELDESWGPHESISSFVAHQEALQRIPQDKAVGSELTHLLCCMV